eukprot:481341_1
MSNTQVDTSQSNDDDQLKHILQANHLFDDLYQLLIDNDLDLDLLMNDLEKDDINNFCEEYEFTTKQKVKFKKLMRIIFKMKSNNIKNDNKEYKMEEEKHDIKDQQLLQFLTENKLPQDLYTIFAKQQIGYNELEALTTTHIDSICNSNNITIGIEIKLKN